MVRLILISDTHSLHNKMAYDVRDFIDSTKENILCHSGDCSNIGNQEQLVTFIEWFKRIKGFNKKLFIGGNHDFAFEKINYPHHVNDFKEIKNALNSLNGTDTIYLEDSEYIFKSEKLNESIKFYGSPWQPNFHNWAFNLMRSGNDLMEKWDLIPSYTDILITHGPPYGIRDYVQHKIFDNNVGCELLLERVLKIKPLLHVFGHIHEGYGGIDRDGIAFINASICNGRYEPINKPIVVEIYKEKNKLKLNYVNT
jgi:Icc-related predicted phosphoesterase